MYLESYSSYSAIIEKYRIPLPAMADYLFRSITLLNKLQRCDKMNEINMFEDIGNSQRSQTLQDQDPREKRNSLRSAQHFITLSSPRHLLIHTQHVWRG